MLVWLWNASLLTQKNHPEDLPPTVPDLPLPPFHSVKCVKSTSGKWKRFQQSLEGGHAVSWTDRLVKSLMARRWIERLIEILQRAVLQARKHICLLQDSHSLTYKKFQDFPGFRRSPAIPAVTLYTLYQYNPLRNCHCQTFQNSLSLWLIKQECYIPSCSMTKVKPINMDNSYIISV